MTQQEPREAAEVIAIDERLIAELIRAFYDRVRADPFIGPVFAARIHDWEPHLVRIGDFWSAVMLRSGRYQGQPMRLHLPLPIDSTHFDRWLELFGATARELCPSSIATQFIERAQSIGRSLEIGIAAAHGAILANGERYVGKPAPPNASRSSHQNS